MSTLPAEYFEFKSVWESVPAQERTINKLRERLRLIEMRLPSKQSESAALLAKSSIKKKGKFKTEKKCFSCHKPDGDAFVCSAGVPETDLWLADSGASAHMTSNEKYFLSYKPVSHPKKVRIGKNEVILAYREGIINVEMLVNKKWERNHLKDVWYVPEVSRNLFSISKTVDKGFKFKVDTKGCAFLKMVMCE